MYRTGDYGRIEKGLVYCEGRTDSQIKVRGHKVDLSEVDAAVNKVDSVDKAVILCYKAGTIDQVLFPAEILKVFIILFSRHCLRL